MIKYPPTPEYHKKVLYNVVWDKTFHYPALVCGIRNLTPEALKEYKASKLSRKIPIMYFCVDRNELYGITSLKDIEPFSYETIFKHKKYHHTEVEKSQLESAVTTAFEDGVDVNNLNEENAGCCDCLKNNTDDELYSYVFCDKCMLAYHWKCEGFEEIPDSYDDYKYVCKRCKEYFSNHSEEVVVKIDEEINDDDENEENDEVKSEEIYESEIEEEEEMNEDYDNYYEKELKEKCRVNDENSFENLKNIINKNKFCLVYRSIMKICYSLFKEIINKQRDNKKKLREIHGYIYGLKVEYLKSEDPHLIETMYRKLDGIIKNIYHLKQ